MQCWPFLLLDNLVSCSMVPYYRSSNDGSGVEMKISVQSKCFFLFSLFSLSFLTLYLSATVGPVVPGQSLWGITKRIGITVDIIESKVCNLDVECSGIDEIISQLDVIESKIDLLSACGLTVLSSDDIMGGAITVSASGNYCLSEDVTANLIIEGDCISVDLNRRCLTGIVRISTDDVELKNGNVTPAAPASAPTAAITVTEPSDRARIVDVQIRNTDTSADGIDGRDGMVMSGNNTQILGCTVIAGAGGDSSTTPGGAGGHAIHINLTANNIVVKNCFFTSGDGGNGGTGTSNGGDAGHGIFIESTATETEITDSTVLSTGNGGDGAGAGTNGNGGNGVKIESDAIDTVLRNCTIRNTGSAGTGGAAGIDGKAVDDDVIMVATASMVYSNFAHNIANTIKFDLQQAGTEQGVPMPNPPTATVINSFANVFVS